MGNERARQGRALKTGKFFLAAGILAHTTDGMILDGTAEPRLRKALSLVNKHDDTFDDFCEFLENHMSHFEGRHPEFPIEEFVDSIFQDGPSSWSGMDAELRMITQYLWSTMTSPAFVDAVRNVPDVYNSLLEQMANDPTIVKKTLRSLEQ
jgi:hypothetical protein